MANYTNHKNNKRLSDETIAEIRRRVATGEKKLHVATDMKLSHAVVSKYTEPTVRISNEIKQRAIDLLDQGFSRSAIAKELNISRKFVGQLRPGSRQDRITQEVKREFIKRVSQGEPVAPVARSLGIDKTYAYILADAQIDQPTTDQIAAIKKRLKLGHSTESIAKELEVRLTAVQKLAGKNKVRIFSDDENLAIALAVSQGLPFKDIAAQFGTSAPRTKSIYKELLKSGLVEPRIDIAMEDDRELLRVGRQYPQYAEWRNYAVQFYKEVSGNFAIISTAINRFFDYLATHKLFATPAEFLLRKHAHRIPSFFDTHCPPSDHGAALNNAVADFLDWVLVQEEFVDVDDDDIPITLPIFKNPIHKTIRSDHSPKQGTESNKNVMPYWMIHDLRRRLAQGPNFRDWHWAQGLAGKETLSGQKESREWYEVPMDKIDKADPDCVWRIRERIDQPSVVELWSPVRWVTLLIKLQTTARLGQTRMMDSGEADTFVFQEGKFVRNKSKLAQGTLRNPRNQGSIRQSDHGGTVLYFNTNKTADIKKVGSEKGMECPWPVFPEYQDDPYFWIAKLARWQSKYNPVEKATAWIDIPSSRRLKGKSEAVCSTYPDATFLFRTPESPTEESFPIAYAALYKGWQKIMLGYQEILKNEGRTNPDGSPIELIKDGLAWITPHGLRVSLITHLIMDGGMAPELMMKIVGHARFIMTIYYTKPGLKRIQEALATATTVLNETKEHAFMRDLQSRTEEELRKHVVFNAGEMTGIIPPNPADRNPIGWMEMHDGICLAGGNTGPLNGDHLVPGCHNGGPKLEGQKQWHGPVPGGVRNCTRCRWKCAGKVHLLGLQATFNNRQYHLYKASATAIEAERNRDEIFRKKARLEAQGEPFTGQADLRTAERLHEAAIQKMEQLAMDLAALDRLICRITQLPEEADGQTALAAVGDAKTLQAVIEETSSELAVLTEICADIELYPDLDPGSAIFEFAQLLDSAFEREGQPLTLARLSEKEKLVAANATMRELERRANPSNHLIGRRKIIDTMDRGASLKQLLGPQLEKILQIKPDKNLVSTPLRIPQFKISE